jgi:hypothetical protein
METSMTIEGYPGTERVLVSYDVSGAARSKATRVCQIVFGRIRRTGDLRAPRQTKEFIHRAGVVWIGQSVLAMPPRDADEFRALLTSMRVRVAIARIEVRPGALEAFRRPARPMA